MEAASLDLSGLIVNGPLSLVVAYLFREVQRLHAERHADMAKQRDFFQRVALKAGGHDDN